MSEKSGVSSTTRGRPVTAKPLVNTNRSGTPASASSASVKSKSRSTTASASGSGKRPPRPPSANSIASSKSSASVSGSRKHNKSIVSEPSSVRGAEAEGESEIKVTKLSSTTVTLQTSWTPPSKPVASTPAPPPASNEQQPTRTSDPLQVAAQAYPWMFMSTTLDACFKSAETSATNKIEARTKELDEQEAGISDQRDRLEAERAIQFYDELGSDMFAKEVPAIMQLFHSHGDSCDKIERDALKLASRGSPDPNDEEPLKDYNNMLDDLESLQTQATDLSNSITKLTSQATPAADNATADDSTKTDESAARNQIINIFSACLPVLRARIANLSMAQELIDSALENASLSLRMESMGLTD